MGRSPIVEGAAAAAARGLRIDVDRIQTHSCRIALPWNLATRTSKGSDLDLVEVQCCFGKRA